MTTHTWVTEACQTMLWCLMLIRIQFKAEHYNNDIEAEVLAGELHCCQSGEQEKKLNYLLYICVLIFIIIWSIVELAFCPF